MPVYEEMTPQEYEEECGIKKSLERHNAFSWLTVQAVVCILALILLLAMKFFVPTVYADFCTWYNTEMDRSILIEYD